jgi:phage I-like protein
MRDNQGAMLSTAKGQNVTALKSTAEFDLPIGEGEQGIPPTEFRVFPAGAFRTSKGTFVFSRASADSVMAQYRDRGNPLMGDYEHMSLQVPPVVAPASISEATPEIRETPMGPELWVVNVQWALPAAQHLRNKEYRLISPAFSHTDEGEILSLVNIALTNLPATYGLQPLVAAKDDGDKPKETEMATTTCAECATKDQEIGGLKAQLTALASDKEALTSKLKSYEDKDNDQMKASQALSASLTDLTGKTDRTEQLAVLTAHKEQAGQFVTLKTQVDADKVAKLTSEYNEKADKAVKAGILPPATKLKCDEIIKTDGIERAMSFLSTFVDASNGTAQVTTLTAATTEPRAAGVVSEAQIKLARQMGKSDAWIKNNLRPLGAGTNA